MKALVLAGGFPQIDLLQQLRARNIDTVLADYYEQPVAKEYANKFYRISTLDVPAIKNLAVCENVDFLITVCTDQALLTVAKVSHELGLPCYIDYETARNVTNKFYMKRILMENGIPTAKYTIVRGTDEIDRYLLHFPLVVKPVDCNSSKGVVKVNNKQELEEAIKNAIQLSRDGRAILEDYIQGDELSVDAFVSNGNATVLDITYSDKLKENNNFIIFRSLHPAFVNDFVKKRISEIVQCIAQAFKLDNTPMLIQFIVKDNNVFVIEFSARTGGGVKHLSIKRRTGFDVVSSVIDLTLGNKISFAMNTPEMPFLIDEYFYCKQGEFDHLEGFELLKAKGIIIDYYLFKSRGSNFNSISNSGDRLGGFSIEAETLDDLNKKHLVTNEHIRAMSINGKDLIRHDLLPIISPN